MGVSEDAQGQTASSRQAQEEGSDVTARVVVASIAALDKVRPVPGQQAGLACACQTDPWRMRSINGLVRADTVQGASQRTAALIELGMLCRTTCKTPQGQGTHSLGLSPTASATSSRLREPYVLAQWWLPQIARGQVHGAACPCETPCGLTCWSLWLAKT